MVLPGYWTWLGTSICIYSVIHWSVGALSKPSKDFLGHFHQLPTAAESSAVLASLKHLGSPKLSIYSLFQVDLRMSVKIGAGTCERERGKKGKVDNVLRKANLKP